MNSELKTDHHTSRWKARSCLRTDTQMWRD